jgi:phage shock protein A
MYDWANLTGDYHDYIRACRHCHQLYDRNRRLKGEPMTGFLQKVRTITLGMSHDLLDAAIDMNSPSALRQYVRDLEDAISKMENEAAIQAGAVRTLGREHGDLTASIAAKKASIQTDLTANPTRARQTATLVVTLQSQLDRNTQELEAQKVTSANLDQAVEKLELKHTDMVSRVRELERMDRTSKAKEQSAAALTSASNLVSGGSAISIDDIESKMRSYSDVASEKFDRAMASTNTEEDPETASKVDDLLASMQPKQKGAA